MDTDKMAKSERLDELVDQILLSAKYKFISPDLVRRIGARELQIRRSHKEAVKATKNKLHQVGGAYFEAKIDYDKASTSLRSVQDDPYALRETCRDLMRLHASTRERLPILDVFYAEILASLPPIYNVLDVACGLNPLAFPWMSLANKVTYQAIDIYGDMMHFLQDFFAIVGVNGRAQQQDVLSQLPAESVDLALILKTLPCLEQTGKGAAARLLDALHARFLLISYPAQSLGGRGKGMVLNYEAQFQALAAGRNWSVKRFEFATELAFLVTQKGD